LEIGANWQNWMDRGDENVEKTWAPKAGNLKKKAVATRGQRDETKKNRRKRERVSLQEAGKPLVTNGKSP